MAKGLMMHDEFGVQAVRYYTRFPDEVVERGISIIVERPSRVPHTSLSELLKAIIQAWSTKSFEGSDLLLVTHGNERGLTMRLFPGHRSDARSDNLEVLMSNDSEKDKATKLYLTTAQVRELVDHMDQVRSLKISGIEFRGCNIGRQSRNVGLLKDFLGTNSAAAPDVLSIYGFAIPDVARDSGQMDRWFPCISLSLRTRLFRSKGSTFRISSESGSGWGVRARPLVSRVMICKRSWTPGSKHDWRRYALELSIEELRHQTKARVSTRR